MINNLKLNQMEIDKIYKKCKVRLNQKMNKIKIIVFYILISSIYKYYNKIINVMF